MGTCACGGRGGVLREGAAVPCLDCWRYWTRGKFCRLFDEDRGTVRRIDRALGGARVGERILAKIHAAGLL
jgi:hypothetical protein